MQNCEKLQNYRFKEGKKEQILSKVCMITSKKGPHSTVYLRRDEKKLVEHKKSGLIFYFGLSFRQRNATCKLTATKDYRGACVS